MNFSIEKGIVPIKVRSVVGISKYHCLPLEEMEVGDSILVPFTFANGGSISSYITIYKKENSVNFTVRKEKTGTRIFKIENN